MVLVFLYIKNTVGVTVPEPVGIGTEHFGTLQSKLCVEVELRDLPDVVGVADLVVGQHIPQEAAELLLGDGDIPHVVLHTPRLVFVEFHPPLLLHRGKNCNVQRLGQVGGVGR